MIQIFIDDKKYILTDDSRLTGLHLRALGNIDEIWDIYIKRGKTRERLIQDHSVFVPHAGDRFYTKVGLR